MIEVKNVTKKYGDFYAVRNINFKVEDDDIPNLTLLVVSVCKVHSFNSGPEISTIKSSVVAEQRHIVNIRFS